MKIPKRSHARKALERLDRLEALEEDANFEAYLHPNREVPNGTLRKLKKYERRQLGETHDLVLRDYRLILEGLLED